MQDPATLLAMPCAFARFSGQCMLKSLSFSICLETHVITASSGLISHSVCLTLPDTRTRVWANCSNHKNPVRRAGNTDTHTYMHRQRAHSCTKWAGCSDVMTKTHTHRRSYIHTHAQRVSGGGGGGVRETGFERSRNRKWRNIKTSGWEDQKTDTQTETTEVWAPEWIDTGALNCRVRCFF